MPARPSAARLIAAFLLAVVALPAAGQQPQRPAQPQPAPQFTIKNEGEVTLQELYVARGGQGARNWGADRFGAEVVPPGESFRVRLPPGFGCSADIRIVFEDGEEEVRERVDICRTREVAFARALPAPPPERELAVENASPRPIERLYVSGTEESEWGEDRLGSDTLAPGDSVTVRVPDQGCSYDIRAVFDTGGAEERRRVDLCTLSRLVIAPGWTTADDLAAPVPREAHRAQQEPRGVAPASPGTVGITNRSDRVVFELYTFPAGARDEGPDRLGAQVLRPGGSVRVPSARPPACATTVRVVYDNGEEETRSGMDFCRLAEVVVAPGWTTSPPFAAARIVNAGTLPIILLHADPPGAPPGPDRLGEAVIGVGQSFSLAPPQDGVCSYDLTAVFRDRRRVRVAGADLCADTEIRIAP